MSFDVCHCSHHKDTHFEKKHACLGMHCDCPVYRDADKPLPLPAKPAMTTPLVVKAEDDPDYYYGWPFGHP